MYIYSTLENIPVRTLFLAYSQAFEDFPSTKNVSFKSFRNMLQMRGYLPEISMGAFDKSNHILAGFILNGFRTWNGKRTVYDILTGTMPSYRRQGLANTLFEKLRTVVRQKNAEQYLTEVKQDNATAIELYKKQGFTISRGLSSFILKKENLTEKASAYKIEYRTQLSQNEWEQVIAFWEFQPSWQNSVPSVTPVQGIMTYALVCSDTTIIGYGVVDTSTGNIHQLAVHKDDRRRGIAGSIVAALFEKAATNQLIIFNVDDAYEAMKLFLFKSGFEPLISQYEIVLAL